jgi:hypothetical protein
MSVEFLDPVSGLPVGPLVSAQPAARPQRRVIAGRCVRLEPLDVERHAA